MNASINDPAEEADALIFALHSRRFVIVRPDESERFTPADPDCSGIHDLKPGDEVIYQGERDSIQSLSAY